MNVPLIRVAAVRTVELNLSVCQLMRYRFWDNGPAPLVTVFLFTLYLSHIT